MNMFELRLENRGTPAARYGGLKFGRIWMNAK